MSCLVSDQDCLDLFLLGNRNFEGRFAAFAGIAFKIKFCFDLATGEVITEPTFDVDRTTL